MGCATRWDLLGLYSGIAVGEKEAGYVAPTPDRVFLYARPIAAYAKDTGERLADVVRHVLIHEIGHHFGLSDADMERNRGGVPVNRRTAAGVARSREPGFGNRTRPEMASTDPLTPEELRWTCDPASLGFETTAELEPIEDVVGQPRAVAALEFGVGMDRRGYNLFCFGPPGAGKHSIVRSHIVRAANGRPPAPDWVYVHNFDEPHRPAALKLPTGRAGPFREAMEQLVRELKAGIPAAFESDEYQARRNVVEQAFRDRQAAAFGALQQEAAAQNIVVVRGEQGIAFAPAADGQPMQQDAFNALPEEQRTAFQKLVEGFQARLQEVMRQYPAWEQETRAALRALNREVARNVTAVLVKEVTDAFSDLPEIVAYLGRIEDDVVDNVFDFLKAQQEQRQAGESGRQIADLVGRPNELTGRDENAGFLALRRQRRRPARSGRRRAGCH